METLDTLSVVVDTPVVDPEPIVVVVAPAEPAAEAIAPVEADLIERVTRLETQIVALETKANEAAFTAGMAESTAEVAIDIANDAAETAAEVDVIAEVIADEVTEVDEVSTDDEQDPKSTSHPWFRPLSEWRN